MKYLCTCGHARADHRVFGSTPRTNGPTTHHACAKCDCWKHTLPKEQK